VFPPCSSSLTQDAKAVGHPCAVANQARLGWEPQTCSSKFSAEFCSDNEQCTKRPAAISARPLVPSSRCRPDPARRCTTAGLEFQAFASCYTSRRSSRRVWADTSCQGNGCCDMQELWPPGPGWNFCSTFGEVSHGQGTRCSQSGQQKDARVTVNSRSKEDLLTS
jgi:hypothetical protein